ncbi:unnamed protein product [Urochloa decumbens]|uniref:DUF1618 domain-containing protein n=1 Tax=Urochloa decumbens TaxID=240449 RepID=A0ABC8WEJ5_9POAL
MFQLVLSPARRQRAWFELAEPPRVSNLRIPEHLVDPPPSYDPYGDHIAEICGSTTATSGDGLLLLDFVECHVTAPIVAMDATTQQRKIIKYTEPEPNVTRFVCNPISGELFRLPDIDGTKRTLAWNQMGLLTQSPAGHGPPDRYAAAALLEDRGGKEPSFVMRRFFSQTGEWDKPVGLPSPLPLDRRISIHSHHEVLAFAGRLWWVDLSWGAISADPFSDRPELRFVELPRGSVLPVHGNTSAEFTAALVENGMYRRMGVSKGRLYYVEMSQKEPFILSLFALDDDRSGWMLEHRVALGRLLSNGGGKPWIGVIDPLNGSVVCVIVGDHVLTIDMAKGKVLRCAHMGDECEYQPRTMLCTYLTSCVLPSVDRIGSDPFYR